MRAFAASLGVLVLSAATAAAAVDPALLALVMPEARIVTGIQVDQSKSSRFGQFVLSQITDNEDLKKFVSDSGFDPRRDLREIVVATTGLDAHGALVIGRGVFPKDRILQVAKSNGGVASLYRGFDLVSATDASSLATLAFLDSNTALVGDAATVKAAIDRKMSGSAGLSAQLSAKAQETGAQNDAWFVTLAPLSEFLGGKMGDAQLGGAMQGNLLEKVKQASGGVKFGGADVGVGFEAVTPTDKDASALADVLRFLASMMQSNQNSNDPKTAKAASLAEKMKLSTTANVMKLSLSIPEADLERMFLPRPKPKAN
ncbi:MAG: hypothetical protein ABI823_20955 [Bryobacteraceae bacterium]